MSIIRVKEISVYVNPGEPTQIVFPAKIKGGFKNKRSAVGLDKEEKLYCSICSTGARL